MDGPVPFLVRAASARPSYHPDSTCGFLYFTCPNRWYVEVHPEQLSGFADLASHPWVHAVSEAVSAAPRHGGRAGVLGHLDTDLRRHLHVRVVPELTPPTAPHQRGPRHG